MAISKAELKKQVEYYLSDKNLTQDKFFNEKLSEGKEGWMDAVLRPGQLYHHRMVHTFTLD